MSQVVVGLDAALAERNTVRHIPVLWREIAFDQFSQGWIIPAVQLVTIRTVAGFLPVRKWITLCFLGFRCGSGWATEGISKPKKITGRNPATNNECQRR